MQKVVLLLVFVALAYANVELTQFKIFIEKFGKEYSTSAEYDERFQIFKNNLQLIDELNSRNTTAKFGVTKYADLSQEEFKKYYLNGQPMKGFDESVPVAPEYTEEEIAATPGAWDWRSKGAVTPVKNQGQCGSCWAFSAVGNMEGQWFLAGNTLTGLSEQNLVDCDNHCMEYENQSVCDAGCDGGLMPNAFMYVMGNGGIDTEAAYPYAGFGQECAFSNSTIGAKVKGWTAIPGNETQMATYTYNHGPISIAVDALQWQFYLFGVFEDPWCGDSLDHGVLIVGFGSETDWFGEYIEFWIIKNSWGGDWGESGYIRVERGSDECGLNLFPCSSIV